MLAGAMALITVTLLLACGSSAEEPDLRAGPGLSEASPPPPLDQELVEAGELLYRANCAACHGIDLSGDPDWKTPNPDGSYPPPPHDSSGHTWHHSDRLLLELIRDGSDFPQTRMPSFGDTLTEQEIISILEYLKSNWGSREREFQWQVTWQETQQSQ